MKPFKLKKTGIRFVKMANENQIEVESKEKANTSFVKRNKKELEIIRMKRESKELKSTFDYSGTLNFYKRSITLNEEEAIEKTNKIFDDFKLVSSQQTKSYKKAALKRLLNYNIRLETEIFIRKILAHPELLKNISFFEDRSFVVNVWIVDNGSLIVDGVGGMICPFQILKKYEGFCISVGSCRF